MILGVWVAKWVLGITRARGLLAGGPGSCSRRVAICRWWLCAGTPGVIRRAVTCSPRNKPRPRAALHSHRVTWQRHLTARVDAVSDLVVTDVHTIYRMFTLPIHTFPLSCILALTLYLSFSLSFSLSLYIYTLTD